MHIFNVPFVTTTSEAESAIFFFVLGRKVGTTIIEPHNLTTNTSTQIKQQKTMNPHTSTRETGWNMHKPTGRKDYPPDTNMKTPKRERTTSTIPTQRPRRLVTRISKVHNQTHEGVTCQAPIQTRTNKCPQWVAQTPAKL